MAKKPNILFILLLAWGLLNNWLLAIIALLPAVSIFVIKAVVYRRASRVLHAPCYTFALPLFSFLQPWVNLYFNIIGSASRKKNFTWR